VRVLARTPGLPLLAVLGTLVPATQRRDPVTLAVELDVARLLATAASAAGRTPEAESSAGVPAASLLVDMSSGEVIAGQGAEEVATGSPAGGPPVGDLRVHVSGILAGHAGTTRALETAGWASSAVPLWRSDDGSRLGLIDVWPVSPTKAPVTLALLLAAYLILVLSVAAVLARHFMRPFTGLAESQAQLEVLYREAREDSLHDGLTGLGNHRSFQEELDRQLDIFRRHHVPLALLLIDLDDLKVVNDGEGHPAGDRLLVDMAGAIRDTLRYGDRGFRIGGDEFAVILPHTDAGEALIAANRLRHFCLRPATGDRVIPFSGGISSVPLLAADRNQLIRQADAALYRCKRQGRGTVSIFDPDVDHVVDDPNGARLGTAVRDVIRGRSLTPVYQPIVDLRDGAVLGFEGLIRPGPATPFANPGQLFAAASASGRTTELDLACFEVVAAGARDIHPDRVISINLSPLTLEASDFGPSWLLEPLARYGLSPGRIIVELTERDAITDLERLRRNIAALQHAGIRLAADDVGAGNAGLRMLSQLRFDIVKIDLSLVQEGAHHDSSRAVVRSLRDLATRQGAVVIAEGVETATQLNVLRELQIAMGQGYLLGRPGLNLGLQSVDIEALSAGTTIIENVPAVPVAPVAPAGPGAADGALQGGLA
jgi:diguanylate cyclase (GGDEF)-like protein